MAPKKVRVSRNPDLIPGVGKCSRSQMYHKRGLWAIKAKNGGVFPRHDKKPAEQPSAVKAPKFYPADDVKKPLVNKRKHKPTKLKLGVQTLGNLRMDLGSFYLLGLLVTLFLPRLVVCAWILFTRTSTMPMSGGRTF